MRGRLKYAPHPQPGSPFTSRKGKSKKKDKGKVTAPQQGLSMSAQLGQDGLPKMPPQEELDKELASSPTPIPPLFN